MTQLKLSLFGSPRIDISGTSVDIPRRKVMALLTYLAVTRQPQRRDALVALLWPESGQKTARASLRRELHSLIQFIGEGWLTTTRATIELNPEANVCVDVEEFRQLVVDTQSGSGSAIDELTAAAELYQGDFLAGFTLSDCPDFDDWQFFETDALRRDYAAILQTLVQHYETQGVFEQAISYARRWLALDAMHEPVHRELMRLFALAGQQAAAVRQYDECMRILDEELGVPPEEETTELFETIRARRFPSSESVEVEQGGKPILSSVERVPGLPSSAERTPKLQAVTPHNLPAQPTPFFGRADELAAIRQLLIEEDECRLLMLIGPGGIGKTRLSLEVASSLLNAFVDGVYFVGLASVSAVENIVTAMAEAVGFSFSGSTEPEQQLANYLRTKQMLLVIDNLEHLLGGVEILSALLLATTKVNIIATSREALGLQDEWLYPVYGMAIPAGTDSFAVVEQNGAIQVFVQRARRADANFVLSNENLQSIVHICQAVHGMPLGIELAAAWMRTMTCHEIAEEITRSVDILATSMRNVPERHRSFRAIFEQTWQRLNEREKSALQRLAVFRGSFTREAAQQVTSASLLDISSLVDKSLCRHDAGRYEVHELLRQLAFERLAPDELQTVQVEHSRYFGLLLEAQRQHVMKAAEEEMLQTIADVFDNVLAAWRYLLEQLQLDADTEQADTELADTEQADTEQWAELLNRYLPALSIYCQRRSLYREGLRVFKRALDVLESLPVHQMESESAANRLHLQLQVEQANLLMPLGRSQEVLENHLNFLPQLRSLSLQESLADALTVIGRSFRYGNDFAQAEPLLTEATALYEQIDLPLMNSIPLHELGNIRFYRTQYEEARSYYQRVLAIYEDAGYVAGVAHCMNSIGVTHEFDGNIQQAIPYYERGYRLARRSNNRLLIAILLAKLGKCAYHAGETDEALEKYGAATEIYREFGYMHWLTDQLVEIAIVHIDQADLDIASTHLVESLELVQKNKLPLTGIRTLATTARLLAQKGQHSIAVSIAMFATSSEHLQTVYRGYCETVLHNLSEEMDASSYKAAQTFGSAASFTTIVDEAIHALGQR